MGKYSASKQVRVRGDYSAMSTAICVCIVFISLCVWVLLLKLSFIQGDDFFAREAKSKLWTGFWMLSLLGLASAGGVGALGYFLSGRSQRVAQWVIVIAMTGLSFFPARSLYNFYTEDRTVPKPTMPTPRSPVVENPAVVNPRVNVPSVPRPSRPSMPMPAGPSVAPGAGPGGGGSSPSTPASPIKPATPSPSIDTSKDDAAAAPVLAALKAEIVNACTDAASQAQKGLEVLIRPPGPDRVQIENRVAALEALKRVLDATSTQLRGASDEAAKRLEAAGLDRGDAMRRAMAFDRELDAFERRIATEALERLCDAGIAEAQLLRDHLGSWRLGPGNKVDSKDASLKGQAGGKRTMVEFGLKDRAGNIAKMRDGKQN